MAFFENAWREARQLDVSYGRESWEKLFSTGIALLEKFVREGVPRIGKIHAVEQSFTLTITSLDAPLIGVIACSGANPPP